jgi:fructose-bisphosphate aldolase, class I
MTATMVTATMATATTERSVRRLRRCFGPDGRTVMIAMDHLPKFGQAVEVPAYGRLLPMMAAADVDAVILRAGPALRFQNEIDRLGLVVSLGKEMAQHDGVEVALRLAADMVKIEVFPGPATSRETKTTLGGLGSACGRWSMPSIVEVIPGSFEDLDAHTAQNIAAGIRLASDLGADVVKTKFVGTIDSFHKAIADAGVPVVVLGGGNGDVRNLFEMVQKALEAGAAGVAVGRRVWRSERPDRVAGGLVEFVHEGLSVDRAITGLTRSMAS